MGSIQHQSQMLENNHEQPNNISYAQYVPHAFLLRGQLAINGLLIDNNGNYQVRSLKPCLMLYNYAHKCIPTKSTKCAVSCNMHKCIFASLIITYTFCIRRTLRWFSLFIVVVVAIIYSVQRNFSCKSCLPPSVRKDCSFSSSVWW